ncbi:MAG: hypothetical protein IT426_09060 [Pirellulales bacterium]|nr:hypothetical protein [Pirellulales bacterium]
MPVAEKQGGILSSLEKHSIILHFAENFRFPASRGDKPLGSLTVDFEKRPSQPNAVYLPTVFNGGRPAYLMHFLDSILARGAALVILAKMSVRFSAFLPERVNLDIRFRPVSPEGRESARDQKSCWPRLESMPPQKWRPNPPFCGFPCGIQREGRRMERDSVISSGKRI